MILYINKIYSSNNIVILCYGTNDQNKQTLQIYHFFRIMRSFLKTGAESCLKRNLKYKNILYNFTELSVGWTSTELQN